MEQFGLTLKWALLCRLDWRPLKILAILNGFMAAPSDSPIRIYTKKTNREMMLCLLNFPRLYLGNILSQHWGAGREGTLHVCISQLLRQRKEATNTAVWVHLSPWQVPATSQCSLTTLHLYLSCLPSSSLALQGVCFEQRSWSSSPEVQALNLGLCH